MSQVLAEPAASQGMGQVGVGRHQDTLQGWGCLQQGEAASKLSELCEIWSKPLIRAWRMEQ